MRTNAATATLASCVRLPVQERNGTTFPKIQKYTANLRADITLGSALVFSSQAEIVSGSDIGVYWRTEGMNTVGSLREGRNERTFD